MAEPWALVSSWTTQTPLFVLLNVVIGSIALISVLASKKNEHPPPPPEHHHHLNHNHQIHNQDSAKTLFRAPSLFSRVTSFNFSGHSFDDAAPNSAFLRSVDAETEIPPPTEELAPESKVTPIETSPSLFERVTSFNRRSEDSEAKIERAPSLFERMTSFNRRSEDSETPPPQSEAKIERATSLLSRMSSFDFSFYRSGAPEPKPEPEQAEVEAREQRVRRSATEVTKKKKKKPQAMRKSASEKETASFAIASDEVDAKADDFINRFKQQLRLQRLDSLLRYRNSAGEN